MALLKNLLRARPADASCSPSPQRWLKPAGLGPEGPVHAESGGAQRGGIWMIEMRRDHGGLCIRLFRIRPRHQSWGACVIAAVGVPLSS